MTNLNQRLNQLEAKTPSRTTPGPLLDLTDELVKDIPEHIRPIPLKDIRKTNRTPRPDTRGKP